MPRPARASLASLVSLVSRASRTSCVSRVSRVSCVSRVWLGGAALVLVACGRREATPLADAAPSSTASILGAAALPTCASKADVDRLHGRRVRVEALYDVDPVVRGKGLQEAYLELPDGTRLVRAYQPVVDELGLVEARVVAIGTVYRDSGQDRDAQQLLAPHFYPERIDHVGRADHADHADHAGRPDHAERAEGPTGASPPTAPPPTAPPTTAPPRVRPPPPVVRTAAELAARRGLWVTAVGTLAAVTADPKNPTWAHAELDLAGAHVPIPFVYAPRWQPRLGTEVTVIGRPTRDDRPALQGAALCATGDRVRCQEGER